MNCTEFNAENAPQPAGGYAQAIAVDQASRLLFISGQIPVSADGALPGPFAEQCTQAWRNVEAQLHAAGMSLDNLVKVTVYLGDRANAMENRVVRKQVLGDRKIAMTVVIAGIFDENWMIEIEAIAAA